LTTFATVVLTLLTLLIGRQEEPVKLEWAAGVVIRLERGADCLHVVQLMPLPPPNPIISCLFKSRLVYLSGTGLTLALTLTQALSDFFEFIGAI